MTYFLRHSRLQCNQKQADLLFAILSLVAAVIQNNMRYLFLIEMLIYVTA